MRTARANLHTHTLYSDGQLSPEALVRKAQEAGLGALAVTDHDTVEGVAEAQAAGRACGVEVVVGVELSVSVGEHEVHLLGYGFDVDDAGLRAHLARFKEARRERARRMTEHLRELGFPVTLADVEAQAADGAALGRPHVAAALVAAGHVGSQQEAFDRFIGNDGPAFAPKPAFPAEEALALLHAAGGWGALAHPGHWTSEETLRALVRAGMDGLEVVHPSHDASLTHYYRRWAEANDLVATGGSDYHGHRAHDEENFGAYTVPLASVLGARQEA